jgi:hypothetical protein
MMKSINRRRFMQVVGTGTVGLVLSSGEHLALGQGGDTVKLPKQWYAPPAEFSQAPFWFWNDDLSEAELVRQLDDFQAHGVHAFTIHPRAGLPKSIGWMSDRMIHFMRYTIEQAAQRNMWVILYDEGMYPSGSSSGQVVAENPAFRTRGLVAIDLDDAKAGSVVRGVRIDQDGKLDLAADQNLIAITKRKTNGHRIAIVDRRVQKGRSYIRGLHFTQDNPPRRSNRREVPENHPPAADILNPEAVACFIRKVYQRFYDEFGKHFGKTVKAIFTDEPSLLAKGAERGMVPGTTDILSHVSKFLGYDFTEYLPTLWYKDEPDADLQRRNYNRALQARLETTFYKQISDWCSSHGIALTGHPMGPDDIGHLRHFHMPGQDIVWRYIEPNKSSALEGQQSTQAKCASSAMIHLKRRRNLNEFCGAYGHNFTFEEMQWLANWLLIRGCNLLCPHAFYYSIRGPRFDERPPDVGPNNTWWNDYKSFADATSRLSWLNTDSKHVCELAILGLNDTLPWRPAKVCFQNQRDFNYLEARHLWEDAQVKDDGIHIAGMHYKALLLEFDPPIQAKSAIEKLEKANRVIHWNDKMSETELVRKIDTLIQPDIETSPKASDLRIRHVIKDGMHYYLLFNEGNQELKLNIKVSVNGDRYLLDPLNNQQQFLQNNSAVPFPPYTMYVLTVQTG